MDQRISMITLGIGDLERARAFYRALGFREAEASNDAIAFFDMGGFALALYGWDALAADARGPGAQVAGAGRKNAGRQGVRGQSKSEGFRGVTLAYNVRMRQNVPEVLTEAEAAGARIVKNAEDAPWGGYSGYFEDPDGHLWEVAWNPFTPLDEDGGFYIV